MPRRAIDYSDPMVLPRLLPQLGYERYADYLASAHWLEMRRAYAASDRPKVCACGSRLKLHLHHLTYERLGAERLDDLIVLCELCHAREHGRVLRLLAAGRRYSQWIGVKDRGVQLTTGEHPPISVPPAVGHPGGRNLRRALKGVAKEQARIDAVRLKRIQRQTQ